MKKKLMTLMALCGLLTVSAHELDVQTTFDLTSADGWTYDAATRTATKVQTKVDKYGQTATFTMTTTNTTWTEDTWKDSFTSDHGLKVKNNPWEGSVLSQTSFSVSVDHHTGEYTHYLNMICIKLWKDGQYKVIGNGGLSSICTLNTGIEQVIEKFGNEYKDNAIDGTIYQYDQVGVPQDGNTTFSATYDKVTWGDYYLEKITVRDDWMTSDIADVYSAHRGFSWRLMDELVPVAYYSGIAYCRSINTSLVDRPMPTETQAVANAGGRPEDYTNYNWIAVHLNAADSTNWDNAQKSLNKMDKVIKAGSVKGVYCDYFNNTHSLGVAYLNPDMICTEGLQFTGEEVKTTRNNYYVANLVCQDSTQEDSVFMMPPKRNEVCNVLRAFVDHNKMGYRNAWNYQNPDSKSATGASTLNGRVFIIDEDGYLRNEYFSENKIGDMHDLKDAIVKVTDTEGSSYFTQDGVDYEWNRNNPNGHYVWPDFYEQTVHYYGIYPLHSLCIEINTADIIRTPKGEATGVDETGVDELTKQMTDVTYVDLMGRCSSTPHPGVNIVVTCYSDGSIRTTKVVK